MNEDIPPETLKESDPTKLIPPLHGALLKNEQDVHLFERLAFLARARRGANIRQCGDGFLAQRTPRFRKEREGFDICGGIQFFRR